MHVTWIELSVTKKFTEQHVSVVHFSYVSVPLGVMANQGVAASLRTSPYLAFGLIAGHGDFEYVHQTTTWPVFVASDTTNNIIITMTVCD